MYNPNLPLIRGLKGDFEVIIDTGEVLNVSSLVDLVHSACRSSVRAVELLARMDWQIIQLDADTLPFTV